MFTRFLLSALLLLTPSTAGALCLPDSGGDPASVYAFLAGFISALEESKSAAGRLEDAKSDSDFLLGFRLAKTDLDCAAEHLSRFQTNKNESISTASRAAVTGFKRLASIQELLGKHMVQIIDAGAAGTLKPGTASDRTAELMASAEDAAGIVLQATVLASYAVVEVDPKTKTMRKLAITGTQRDLLVQRLLKTFGPDIKNGLKAGQTRLMGAAVTLYSVLADPKRETRPERPLAP